VTVCLYLVSLLLPAPMLLVGCLLVSRLSEDVLSPKADVVLGSREKIASSQEPKTGLDRIAEMSSRSMQPSGTRRKMSVEAWTRAFPRLSKVGYKNSGDPKSAFNDGRNTQRNREKDLEHGPRQDIQMHRLSSDVWLENGHARRSSGKMDRIISLMAPLPQLSVMASRTEDPNATPKASKINARAGLGVNMSPISFRAGPAYCDLSPEEAVPARGPTIQVETPTKFDRSAFRYSAATSPGAKSVKTAEVKLATRTRMSQTPVFLFGGSQGDMIMSPRPSMEAAGLVEEGREQRIVRTADKAQDASSDLESSLPGEVNQLRRRTLELAKGFLGVRERNHQPGTVSYVARDFVQS
jgi:hypothetical protein